MGQTAVATYCRGFLWIRFFEHKIFFEEDILTTFAWIIATPMTKQYWIGAQALGEVLKAQGFLFQAAREVRRRYDYNMNLISRLRNRSEITHWIGIMSSQ